MALAFAHIITGENSVHYFRENYARIAPESEILSSHSVGEFLVGGPESELKRLCDRYGGHPVTELEAELKYTSEHKKHGLLGISTTRHYLTTTIPIDKLPPAELLKTLKRIKGNPWRWFLLNEPRVYDEHENENELRRGRHILETPTDRPNFVINLWDGIHSFVAYEKYGL